MLTFATSLSITFVLSTPLLGQGVIVPAPRRSPALDDCELPVYTRPSFDEFEQHIKNRTPAVLLGLTDGWAAHETWNPVESAMLSNYPDLILPIRDEEDIAGSGAYQEATSEITLKEYLSRPPPADDDAFPALSFDSAVLKSPTRSLRSDFSVPGALLGVCRDPIFSLGRENAGLAFHPGE